MSWCSSNRDFQHALSRHHYTSLVYHAGMTLAMCVASVSLSSHNFSRADIKRVFIQDIEEK